MNNTENPSTGSWERIQGGVRETERLIGQKKYNMAMIKARQTLEFMVKNLCDKAGIQDSGLIDMIDALYESNVINKTTSEHYHKIRIIGNKATHEDDNSAYNANQAHHLLSQEVYTFANDYDDKKGRSHSTPVRSSSSRASSSRKTTPRQQEAPPRRPSSRRPNSRRRKARSSRFSLDPGSLLKPLLLIAIIIVLIFIIYLIRPDKDENKETETTAPITTEFFTEEASTEETESEPPTTPAAVMYKTNDSVNVRSSPSIETGRIGLLAPGTQVEYVRDHDDKWCVIKYNGNDAYVAKEFLTPES